MKLRTALSIIVAIAMVSALALSASAAMKLTDPTVMLEDGGDRLVIRSDQADDMDTDLTVEMIAQATALVVAIDVDEDGLDSGFGFIWGGETGGWWNQADLMVADFYADGKLTIPMSELGNYAALADNEVVKVYIAAWGAFDMDVDSVYLEGIGGTPAPVVTDAPVVTAAAGDTAVASDAQKDGADTGIADVAVASAIALVAAGAVVFSRKKK
jgi:hypothetical protein